ncbi:hypothetical protein O4H53_03335 [Sulfitobacter sp. G21635-S1]|uniref:hypothetical protein n=1 Tax=Sulfitobacter sp. G21635-S1 TaxID=3014043 RepID=UPI0022AEE4AC|nr:hypothetical protein [Sulfitobacter sp. G21635-S1]MCZ4254559.1 hypothetical protein [Sulfitobacter sp. G21635-S1]
MILLALIYLLLAFGALAALCIMILRIGAMIGTCPQTGAAARAAAVTIATGFAAIGTGGVILIGALLPLAVSGPVISFLLALGLASLCLGLGFTHAVGTLRAVLATPARDNPRQQPEPA